MLDSFDEPLVYSNFCRRLMPTTDVIDADYVGVALRALYATGGVQQYRTGSAIPNLAVEDLLNGTSIPNLPEREQAKIVECFGALGDAIRASRRVSATCDALIRTYFDEALKSESAASRPLSSLAKFINGKAFTKGATGTGRVVVRIAEINSGLSASTVYNDIDVPDRHLARPGDVLFAWSGSLTAVRWFRDEAVINQHIFKVTPQDGLPAWYVLAQLDSAMAWFRGLAADKATTMGHIQRKHLDMEVPVLSGDALQRLSAICQPLWDRALAAERELLALEAILEASLGEVLEQRHEGQAA